ncbi:MAG TPA: hypothetical protein VN200_03330, partial [Rhodoglobus sp.]|nr:hypothetical protein [Rhodoglobus sp.]
MPARTRPVALSVAALLLLTGLAPATVAAAAPDTGGLTLDGEGSALLTASTESVAPGLELTSFRRQQPNGWVTGHVMVADLAEPTLSLDLVDSGTVTGGARVSEMIDGTGAVAAINGDYFDINASTAPVGTNVSSEGVETISAESRNTLTVADGIAAVAQLTSGATATFAGTTHDVDVVNSPALPAGELGWFTSAWGAYPLDRPLGGPGTLPDPIARVGVVDGEIVSVTTNPAA